MATTGTRIDLSRLAPTGPVVGRTAQIKELQQAWDNPAKRVFWITAGGGAGKSALVNAWLAGFEAEGLPGADRVFGWTFHGQGAGPAHASADAFLDYALRWFGDDRPTAGSPWERGARLARQVQAQRTLLVLDGVDEHQDGADGRLRNPALEALVRALARRNPGLCVVTSRRPRAGGTAGGSPSAGGPAEKSLALDSAAAKELFAGLDAEDQDVEAAVARLSGHPYALAVLAAHVREAFNGQLAEGMAEIFPSDEPAPADPVGHMLTVCERYLEADPERAPYLSLLRLAGLLDGPADPAAVRAVRSEPEISGLTSGLGASVADTEVAQAAADLREARLLAGGAGGSGRIDAPRAVRSFFRNRVEKTLAAESATASGRFFDHFCSTAPEVPETVEDLLRLQTAVAHGCRAGKPQEAYDRVYRRRIAPEGRFWSTFRLGAFDAEVAVLEEFFPPSDPAEMRWSTLPTGLDEEAALAVLMAAGVNLRSLGRLAEAERAFQTVLDAVAPSSGPVKNPGRAADAASSLSEVALARGRIDDAIGHARAAVAHADASRDLLRRASKRAYLADALHQAGRLGEAEEAFRAAEAIQEAWQPAFPLLYSLRGYQFHDFLLREPEALLLGPERPSREERSRVLPRIEEVLGRVRRLFSWRRDSDSFLDVALEHLVRGRARLARDLARGEEPSGAAGSRLDQAVTLLREYAAQYRLPCGLLARAAYRRVAGDFAGAAADLDEALGIAEHGEMALLRIDVHLERARLEHAREELDEARKQLGKATELMKDRGYHRRDRDVADLTAALA